MRLIVFFALSCLLTGCDDKEPYFLDRGTAAKAIEQAGMFRRLTEVEFTTGRQTLGNSVGATTALESGDGGNDCQQDDPAGLYTSAPCRPRGPRPNRPVLESDRDETVRALWQPVHPDGSVGKKNTPPCVPLEEETCYFNWVAPKWEPLLADFEKQHVLTKVRVTTPTRNCPPQNHWGQEWKCRPGQISYEMDSYEYHVKIGKLVVAVTGILKEGNHAKVEFFWEYRDINQLGELLNISEMQRATRTLHPFTGEASFSDYDDGWRITSIQLHGWLYGPEAKSVRLEQ